MKKIAIIGVGGKTGTMFVFELEKAAEVLGIGKEKEIEMINQKRVYIDRDGRLELFEGKIIKDSEFKEVFQPDFILLATKNPVGPAIKFYYSKFKGAKKIPALLIPQNGFSPLDETKNALKEILEKEFEKVKIFRLFLFNPIQKKEIKDKIFISYSLPIKIALTQASGQEGIEELIKIFKKSHFDLEIFPKAEAKNLEFSKLFLNLVGMASSSREFPVREGFSNSEILKEEIEMLKEYIKVVKTAGGKFLNFSHYPVKFLTHLLELIPTNLLLFFGPLLVKIVREKREEKPKELDEIEYYNGAVVKLGKKLGIKTPVNERIYKRVREKLKKD
jgi:ketopantoate reductase